MSKFDRLIFTICLTFLGSLYLLLFLWILYGIWLFGPMAAIAVIPVGTLGLLTALILKDIVR